MGYVLVEDIFDEMCRDISLIKLNVYLKRERKEWFFLSFIVIFVILLYNYYDIGGIWWEERKKVKQMKLLRWKN